MGQRFKRPRRRITCQCGIEKRWRILHLYRARDSRPVRKSGHSLNGLHFVQIRSIAYEHVEVQDGLAIVGFVYFCRHSAFFSPFLGTLVLHHKPRPHQARRNSSPATVAFCRAPIVPALILNWLSTPSRLTKSKIRDMFSSAHT